MQKIFTRFAQSTYNIDKDDVTIQPFATIVTKKPHLKKLPIFPGITVNHGQHLFLLLKYTAP